MRVTRRGRPAHILADERRRGGDITTLIDAAYGEYPSAIRIAAYFIPSGLIFFGLVVFGVIVVGVIFTRILKVHSRSSHKT